MADDLPNVEMIWGLNLPGTPRATSASRGTLLLILLELPIYYSSITDASKFSLQSKLYSFHMEKTYFECHPPTVYTTYLTKRKVKV